MLRLQAARLRSLSSINRSVNHSFSRAIHQSAAPSTSHVIHQSIIQPTTPSHVHHSNRSIMISAQATVESTTQLNKLSSNSSSAPSTNPSDYQPLFRSNNRGYVSWTTSTHTLSDWTSHSGLQDWILDKIRLARPARVHLCDGSAEENEELITGMKHSGVLVPLNDALRPNSYVARSTTSDVARVEERTYICSEQKSDAGFTNNWADPEEMMKQMEDLFDSCMRGRTMYVVPFCMSPLDSPFSMIGVQITDSPYVVANMRIMTRMGEPALRMLGEDKPFIPCVHSVGAPLVRGAEDSTWPQNSTNKYIVHFPEERRIWSYGSGYGGNALLGKKCLALRIASAVARDEGWLAEHMLIVGITNPQGVKKYIAAAFPSACGKTNMAMLTPSLPGWKVETVGDDIAWMRIGPDGRLWAVNPEAGFFGVAPGTSMKSNPNAMKTMSKNTLFTNVAITQQGDVYWEGMTDTVPKCVTSWLRTERFSDATYDAAHPNSRFTVPASQCPVMDKDWESPQGVPISAIIFGGRRSTAVPLVYEARNWEHGVFVGASMTSETTAAAAGKRGILRNDPFAMRPFCGYNMGDYFAHWASMAQRTQTDKLPKIFHVNWFRRSKSQSKFLWPGFGENIRVIDWIFKRCDEPDNAELYNESSIGLLPKDNQIDMSGLDIDQQKWSELMSIEPSEWIADCKKNREFFSNFGDRLPAFVSKELDALQATLEDEQTKLLQQQQQAHS